MTVEQRPAWYQDPVGYVREGIEESRGSRPEDSFGRPTSGGLIEGVIGNWVNADDGSSYRKAATNQQNKEDYKARIEALKGTFTPGLAKGDYEAQLVTLSDQYKDDRYPKTPAGRLETRTTKALEAQTGLERDKLGITASQNAQNYKLALIQAADSRSASAAQLELSRQQMVREDQRYNERMEKLDRQDRRSGRQSLVAGLAALGAAFAL
jgi:hypothetical protein